MLTRNYVSYLNRVLRIAYANQGATLRPTELIAFEAIWSLSCEDLASSLLAAAQRRLSTVLRDTTLMSSPVLRRINFWGVPATVCAINEQGVEWYIKSPIENFDFCHEHSYGLLPLAGGTIFDLGAHQGIWSIYYCKRSPTSAVFAFEPSIINIEAICINALINSVGNLHIVPAAVGTSSSDNSERAASDMLVDFVGGRVPVCNLEHFGTHRADFAKVDIEGFEYDLIIRFDWFFELATHFHLELHIPHLEKRGLDYREAYKRIPFEQFEVTDWQTGSPVTVGPSSPISGFPKLMLKRRHEYL